MNLTTTIRALYADLNSAESVARVLDVSEETVLQHLPGPKTPSVSPLKGRKLGPRPAHWLTPGPAPAERCIRGHPFDEENTIVRQNGTKTCRTCNRERVRRNDAKRDWAAVYAAKKERVKGGAA